MKRSYSRVRRSKSSKQDNDFFELRELLFGLE